MAKLNSVSKTWDEYGGWVILLVVLWFLFTLRKAFTAAGDTLSAKVEAATAEARRNAETKAAKSAVKAATGVTWDPTDDEVTKWRADATSLAAMFDATNLVSFQRKQGDAFTLLKRGYSRLNLYNNKPCKWADKTKKKVVSQTSETSESIKNSVNWKVLVPFYKEATDGRDLLKDIHLYIYDADKKALLKWIL